ncbi:MAG TPA: V4R domain-containing protein, partial [Candidatus Hodarchaeales archaeon]|nr:V4R domain-containing protein [Candidatus Hodarchaeales archaeon]
ILQQAFTTLKIMDSYCGMLLYSAGVTYGIFSDKRVLQLALDREKLVPPISFSKAIQFVTEEFKHPTAMLTRKHSFVLSEITEDEVEEVGYIILYELAYAAGASDVGETFCDFMAGFINGRLQLLVAADTIVKEVECFGLGNNRCRFKISVV